MSDRPFPGIGMTSARTRERLIDRLRSQGIHHEGVLERFRAVPRHIFVDEALASRAYEDTALPIGFGQTISQPYVVALMTEALVADLAGSAKLTKVLEVGTGCGYQTAILAPFVQHIYSLERIGALADKARNNLRSLKINNVTLRQADGWRGWQSQAPFDGILVAAAPPDIPDDLLTQLGDGGRLIIPVGLPGRQELVCISRDRDEFVSRSLGMVSFVPLVEGLGNE